MSTTFNYKDLLSYCCVCLKPMEPASETETVSPDFVDPQSGLTVAMMLHEVLLDSSYHELETPDSEGNGICKICFQRLQNIRLFRSQCTEVYGFYKTLLQAQSNDDQLSNLLADSISHDLRAHLFRLGVTSSENLDSETLLSEIGCIKSEKDNALVEDLQNSPFISYEVEIDSPKFENYPDSEGSESSNNETLATIQRKEQASKAPRLTVCPVPDCQQQLVGNRYTDHLKEMHRYGCKQCGIILKLKHVMEKHVTSHSQNQPTVKCSFCERMFCNVAKMRCHARDVHLQQAANYECDQCGEMFERRKLLNIHRESHLPKNCAYCEYQFDHSNKLLYHVKRMHPTHLLRCNVCRRMFVTQALLDRHSKKHTESPFSEDSYQLLTLKNLPIFVCDQCEKQFTSEAHRLAHMTKHDPASRPKVVFKRRSKAELAKLEKKFKCDQCDACYRLPTSLETHLKTHSATFVCDICGAFFNNKSNLKQHITYKHTRNYRYFCEFCPKACATSSDLLRHRRVHTNERPYQCELCKARFKTNDGYRKHMRAHSGERIYRCDLCEKTFKDHCSLKTHKIAHTNEKAFKCFHCEQHFNVPRNRRRHILRAHPGLPTKLEQKESTEGT